MEGPYYKADVKNHDDNTHIVGSLLLERDLLYIFMYLYYGFTSSIIKFLHSGVNGPKDAQNSCECKLIVPQLPVHFKHNMSKCLVE